MCQHKMDMNHGGHNMTITTEKEFLVMMVPHHQEAIDTSLVILEKGGEMPEVKKLAQNIVVAQEKEIAQMKKWHQAWFGTPLPQTDKYTPMMRPMSNLSGKALDQQFIEDMVDHHEGAIAMAKQAQEFSQKNDLLKLVDEIISTQEKE